jgi:hypothetical protein
MNGCKFQSEKDIAGISGQTVLRFLASVLLLAICNLCAAQTYWEMSPYKTTVLLAIDGDVRQDNRLVEDLPIHIVERVDNRVGAAWQVTVEPVKGELREKILRRINSLSAADLEGRNEGVDKIVALSLSSSPAGFLLRAREYDERTQTWGNLAEAIASQKRLVADVAFDVLWQAFAPIAQIDVDADKKVFLRPRAAGLPLRDPALQMILAGDLFQPIIRKIDRKGKAAKAGVQPMPWTFLIVDQVSAMQATCKLQSGLRQSLGTRRRGQSEQLAIAVRPLGSSTRLTVLGRGKPPKPLPGYDVFGQVPEKKEIQLIGRTDANGQVDIPAIDSPVRILYVKGGGILLARLPMVPGLNATATAEVADDDVRLGFEGFLTAVNDDVVDLVARRAILIARARNRMAAGKLDEAEKFFDELRRLPDREEIALEITEEKTRNATADPAVQAKLDKLAAESQKMLRRFLDPKPIDTLRSELNQAAVKPAAPAQVEATSSGQL